MAIPRSPCSAPITEGSLLLPKSGLPTAVSKQVKHMSVLMERSGLPLYVYWALFFSPGSYADSSNTHMNNLKRGPQLRQPQPLLYVTTTGAGSQRTRRHWAIIYIYSQHQHWHPEPPGSLCSNWRAESTQTHPSTKEQLIPSVMNIGQHCKAVWCGHTSLLFALMLTLSNRASRLWDLRMPKIVRRRMQVLFCPVFPP